MTDEPCAPAPGRHSWFSRCWGWVGEGPPITMRQFLVAYILLFLLATFLLTAVMYLVRQNERRIAGVRHAIVVSCQNSNEVRSEVRYVIQDVKNLLPYVPWHDDQERWLRLTAAQARLHDKRCLP